MAEKNGNYKREGDTISVRLMEQIQGREIARERREIEKEVESGRVVSAEMGEIKRGRKAEEEERMQCVHKIDRERELER